MGHTSEVEAYAKGMASRRRPTSATRLKTLASGMCLDMHAT